MLDLLKSVYLAWQSPSPHRRWYPVGLLEFERIGKQAGFYRFGYVQGALRAAHEAGFCPIDCFPDINQSYESAELFPLFQNRVMDDKRTGFSEYLDSLALPPRKSRCTASIRTTRWTAASCSGSSGAGPTATTR